MDLDFDHHESDTGGSVRPTKVVLRGLHPETGEQVGQLSYLVPRRKADKILIDRLEVNPEHQGHGYAGQLMDELQRRHPKTPIDHGSRTDEGARWWKSYTRGKSVQRGRTIARVDPDLVLHDRTEDALHHSELTSQGNLLSSRSRVASADLGHLSRSEAGVGVAFADSASVTSLAHHVGDIVGLGAVDEVAEFDAGRRVAGVAQGVSRPGAVGQEPRDTMGQTRSAFVEEDPVSLPVRGRRPQQASGGVTVGFCPESIHGSNYNRPWDRTEGRTAAQIPPAYPNPRAEFREGGPDGTHWYHGTATPFEGPLKPTEHDYGHSSVINTHWNTALGVHFASAHDLARGFARNFAGTDSATPEHARIAHATLHMRNPADFETEHDLADHAIRTARRHGLAYGDTDDPELRDINDGYEDEVDLAHKDHWLNSHPDRERIVRHVEDDLKKAGHDGILYGNSYEGTPGHQSAIAFRDTPVRIHHWEHLHEGHPNHGKTASGYLEPLDEAQRGMYLRHPVWHQDLGSEDDATATFQYLLRRGGHPEADDAEAFKHPNPSWHQSQLGRGDVGQLTAAIHPDRWDYGTLAHETAHALHQLQTGAKPASREHAHDDDFMEHYRTVGNMVSPGAGDDLHAAYRRARYGKEASHVREAGKGKPRHDAPDVARRAQEAAEGPGGDLDADSGGNAHRPRQALVEHPRVAADLKKLPRRLQDAYRERVDGLRSGAPHSSTHPLSGPLRGWNATSLNFQTRLVHRTVGDELHVLSAANHDEAYDQGARRLGMENPDPRKGRDADPLPNHAPPSPAYPGHAQPRPADTIRTSRYTPPHERVFSRTYGLDKRLWEDGKLRQPIRVDIMATFAAFCHKHWLAGHESWSRIVFFGSEASEWTSKDLIGNDDFDLSIGIQYDLFRARNESFADKSDAEIADWLTRAMHAELNDPQKTFPGVDGVYDETWFANLLGWDIAEIRPYSAFDVVAEEWIVEPPHLPDWSMKDFPQGPGLAEEIKGVVEMAEGILRMAEPYKTQAGAAFWEFIHSSRSQEFGPNGEGWWGNFNLLEKALDQKGLMQQLWELHNRAVENPGSLRAPEDWSNDPSRVRERWSA